MNTLHRVLTAQATRVVFAAWSLVGAATFVAVVVGTGDIHAAWPWASGAVSCGLAAGILHAYARRSQ